jgi:hypothetical protein
VEKDSIVFRDERYVLGQKNGLPFIIANGEEYTLTCHPYEPCLYITSADGKLTAVHNAFDPSSVLQTFSEGARITSVTGTDYNALDFCRMVEYAAGRYDVQIDEAEKVFGTRAEKKDREPEKPQAIDASIPPGPESGRIIEDDAFSDVIDQYPDSVIDICLVKNDQTDPGYNAHRHALLCASRKLFVGEDDAWHFDVGKAKAKQISTRELFASGGKNGEMDYRKAFLEPPFPNGYTDADFDRINAALFPNGIEGLEAYEWTTDWSEYFDEGREWWGTLCLTVYDRSLDRFVVIMASATD